MKINDLENKKIAIWGLGVEGKATLEVLKKRFPNKDVVIIDDKNCPQEINKEGLNIFIMNQIQNLDVIIRSPGVSIYKPEIIYAKKILKIIVITEKTIFFSELEGLKVKTIGITGTKGKTTTSTFCATLLQKLGYKILLCGNMGVATIKLIDEAKKMDYVVVEMSSYQCSDLLSFPTLAILLNLFPEHLQWHLSHQQYYEDKSNLLKGAKYKIINGVNDNVLKYTENIENKIEFGTKKTIHWQNGFFYDEKKKLFSTKNMKLLGEHNYQNLCSILTVFKILKIDFTKIKQEYFDNFDPIEHRLEIIKCNEILFVNDSIATIPEATIACYNIFKDKNIYGILGGFDRGQDYTNLAKNIISDNVKFITLLGQTAPRIAEALTKYGFNNFLICGTLKVCFETLYNRAKEDKNSVIILSPASPSYDMYKNFEERGNEFKNFIKELKKI